ncbi:probable protein disulfide-isomerase A6 isoform X2 [Vigna radiata var. radiata]|uniref:Probable protein disulfide-isomerase A6 isoform X2 n=1 Tax=Vigna radiata var. radiata TaxID=3916 RepID=A0A3Q0F5E7_VIGRR|nr:probable protein disulfide-isomerase A6 isoform X2 [Vigna radiata var. radiata]
MLWEPLLNLDVKILVCLSSSQWSRRTKYETIYWQDADDNYKKAVYSQLEEEVKKLKGFAARYGSLYLKLPKKSMEKGTNYAKNEILRLDRMLEKENMDDIALILTID